MVVPDGIVQSEETISVAPGIPGPLVLLQHNRGDTQLLEPGCQHDPSLAPAHDYTIGLLCVTEGLFFSLFYFMPDLSILVSAVLGPKDSSLCPFLFVPLQLFQCGQQGPGFPTFEAHISFSTTYPTSDVEKALHYTIGPLHIIVAVNLQWERSLVLLEGSQHLLISFKSIQTPRNAEDVPPEECLLKEAI